MQLACLDMDWKRTLKQAQLHMNLLEPFVAFRRVLLQILNCQNYTVQHLLESAATLRKVILLYLVLPVEAISMFFPEYILSDVQVSRFSQAASALHEFKFLCAEIGEHCNLYWLGRVWTRSFTKLIFAATVLDYSVLYLCSLRVYCSVPHQSEV